MYFSTELMSHFFSILISEIYQGAMNISTRTSKVYLLQLPCTQRTALKAGPLKPKLLCGLYDIVAFTVEICFLLLQLRSILVNFGNGRVLPRPLKEVAYVSYKRPWKAP